jgi:diguanylate cyclase (GGDEF)-like protein
MARLSLFAGNGPEQALRFRRYLMVAGTALLVLSLLAFCFWEGTLPARPFIIASGAILAAIVAFHLLFRFEWNKRSRDPSLTVPMMVSAICVTTYVLYHIGPARGVFLLVYLMVMLFGVLRLDSRALLAVSAFILFAYGLVIALLTRQPSEGHRLPIEILQWTVLTVVLIWFSLMGGYIGDLRTRLRQSEYDELTLTYNRRRVLEILEHEKMRCDRGGGPLCICMIDIDLFKAVNDNLGHQAGDLVLQIFVKVAQAQLRSIDFLGRYGGEEFLLVLPGTALEGARECAERVRSQTESTNFSAPKENSRITISIGVTQYRSEERVHETLKRADAALYRAKAAGRNQVEYE